MERPNTVLYDGIKKLFQLEKFPWDDYYARMAQTDFFSGMHGYIASKTYFIRDAPFGGSFSIMGGLTAFIRQVHEYRFDDPEVVDGLYRMGFKEEFVEFLKEKRRLIVNIYAIPEGKLFFPNEPAIVVEGELWALRFIEGMLLTEVNFPSLLMCKWSRVATAAFPGSVTEFSRRRAQNHLKATLYAYLSGASATSNAEIQRGLDIPVVGTMGHEYIQSFSDELTAFRTYLEHNPDRPVLLIDTVDTLKSGLPNAITAFKDNLEKILNANGYDRMAIRNDSGDLAVFAIEERAQLDAAGLHNVRIMQTNDLDEYSIINIKSQIYSVCEESGINSHSVSSKLIWACGTKPGVCSEQPSSGGVAKLTSIKYDGNYERSVIKFSNDRKKTSIPGSNRSNLIWRDGKLVCCLVHGKDETRQTLLKGIHPNLEEKVFHFEKGDVFEPRQVLVYNGGISRNIVTQTLEDIRNNVKNELSRLHWTNKRLSNPEIIDVVLSDRLFEKRKFMINSKKLMY